MQIPKSLFFPFFTCFLFFPFISSTELSPNSRPDVGGGYLAFCPCMGRFGNQIDQVLGVMAFAKRINRTLILPPLIEYPYLSVTARMVPFGTIFDVPTVARYLPVIEMSKFMKDLAPAIWPPEERLAFCWAPRKSIYDDTAPIGCNAKEGNPFGPFWDYSGVNFVADEYYGSVEREASLKAWTDKYSASKYSVLAFTGAPAAFPVKSEERHLQQYLKFKPRIQNQAITFVKENLARPFVGIHLRNNVDWDNVCKTVIEGQKTTKLFASPQCLGYNNDDQAITPDMCAPSEAAVLAEVEAAVVAIRAKTVFVASDRDHLIPELNGRLHRHGVKAVKLSSDDPYVSLAVLTLSDHFIANCISTYSAFVVRAREFGSRNDLKKTTFFGYHPEPKKSRIEL